MKKITLILFTLYSSVAFATEPTLEQVRNLFFKAEKDESACQELIQLLAPYHEENNPLFLGYKGIATIILAKHVSNPFVKLSHFKKGKNMLEKSIEVAPERTELRYLRFAVQTNIPTFLGYHKNIQSDKAFLYKETPKLKDEGLKRHIMDYLKYVAKRNKY